LSRCDKPVRAERTEDLGQPLRRSTRRYSSQRDEFHLLEWALQESENAPAVWCVPQKQLSQQITVGSLLLS
jgi:hypothetical protein